MPRPRIPFQPPKITPPPPLVPLGLPPELQALHPRLPTLITTPPERITAPPPPPLPRLPPPALDRVRFWGAVSTLYPDMTALLPEVPNEKEFAGAVTSLLQVALEDPDTFLEDLRKMGRSEESAYLLSTVFGASAEDIEEFFGVQAPIVLPSLDWLDKVREVIDSPEKLLPFVSSGVEIVTLGRLLKTALDLEAGKEVSREDLLALKEYVDRSQRDTTWGNKVLGVLTNLVPFAGEFALTGGIFATGKYATVKAGTMALKRLATKTGAKFIEGRLARLGVEAAGIAGGGTLRAIPMGVTRIPAETIRRQLHGTLTGDEEAVWRSTLTAVGANWVEVVSESTGGLFTQLAAPIKGQLVKMGLFQAFLKANPTAKADDVRRVLQRMGYDGVLAEMLEERVADVGHGILAELGLGDQKFQIPSLEQLSVELVAFAVPGVAMKAMEKMPQIIPAVKTALAGEVGAVRFPPGKKGGAEVAKVVPPVAEGLVTPEAGRLLSLFPTDTTIISHRRAFARAKELGLVKTPEEYKALLAKEIQGGQIWGGSGSASRDVRNRRLGIPDAVGYIEKPRVAPAEAGVSEARQALRNFEEAMRKQNEAIDRFGFNSAEADAARIATRRALTEMERTTPITAEAVAAPPTRPLTLPAEEVVVPRAVAEKLAAAKQTIKELRKTRAETERVKSELVKVIKEHLPLPRQGELLAKVKNAKTEADLAEAVTRVEDLAEAEAEKTLRADITKELKKTAPKIEKGITVGRLSAEVQPVLNQLRAGLLLNLKQGIQANTEAYGAARDDIGQNVTNYQEGKISSDAMMEANERLKYVGLHGMSTAQLQETLDYIRELKQTGKDFRKAKREAVKAEAEEIRTQGIDGITGGQGVKPGVGALRPEDLAAAKRILDQPVNSQYGFVNLLDKLDKFTRTEAYKGYLMRFNAAVQRATNTENMERERSLKLFGEKLKEVYKVPKAREATRLLNAMTNEDIDLGTFPITTIREGRQYLPIKLTKAQMMEVYQLYKNPKNLETFKEGMHWPPEVITSVVGGLSEQDITFADWLQDEFYPAYYDKINPFYREEFNIDMPKNPDYVPQSRDFTAKEDNEVTMLLRDQGRYASVTNKSLKARQQNIRPFKLNGVFTVATNHIVQMEHFMAWAKPMHELRRFFGNAEVRTAIKQYHSGDIVTRIDDYMNDFARGGQDQAQFLSQLDKVRSRFAVAVLGLKPSIGLQQIWTVGAFMTEMKARDFVSGFADFWAHPVRNYQWMMENSPYIKQRYTGGNYERDIRLAQRKGGLKALSGQGNISQWFLWQVTQGDKFGVMPGWWAKYQAGLKGGLTQADAMLEADAASERTQNTSEIASLAWLQRGSSWGKLVTMFQSQPNKYFRIVADNIRNMQYGRTSKVKGMTNLFIVWVLLPALFQLVADAFQLKKEHQARVLLLGPLNNILVVGQLLSTAWGWFTGDNFDWQASPVLSTVRDVQNFSSKALKVYNQARDPYKDVVVDDIVAALEFLAKAVGQLTGLPTPYLVNVEKALRGTEGKRDLRELIFSRWALEKPKAGLAQQAEDVLEGLGMPIEEKPEAGRPLSQEPLSIFDMAKLNSKYRTLFGKTLPEDITQVKGFEPMAVAWGEKEISRSQADMLPDVPLYKINTEDTDDTIVQYYKQWQVRTPIKSLADLVEFDKLYPKAHLGNVTRRQYNLLVKYLEMPEKERKAFLESHPELKVNPRNEWLKANPEGNAQLALWGDAKILTLAAYKAAQRLMRELDIPDDAIPESTLPPDKFVEDHFALQKIVEETSGSSIEAKLFKLEHPEYLKWGLEQDMWEDDLSDEHVEALRIRVDSKALFEKYDAFGDEDSPSYVKDEKERALARERFLKQNPEFKKDRNRVEAYGLGLAELATDTFPKPVEDFVNYYEISIDGFRRERWLQEHPEFYEKVWRSKDVMDNAALDFTKIPDVRYDDLLDKWKPQLKLYEDFAEQAKDIADLKVRAGVVKLNRDRVFAGHPGFFEDKLRMDAHADFFPGEVVEDYVSYYSILYQGKPNNTDIWYADDRFLKEHPEFYEEARRIRGWTREIDWDKIPTERWEKFYNESYFPLTAEQRYKIRGKNPWFDEEGVAMERWKPYVPPRETVIERMREQGLLEEFLNR